MPAHLLLASAELVVLDRLARLARDAGHSHAEARTPERLLELVRRERPDLCLIAASFPELARTLELLEQDDASDAPHVLVLGTPPSAALRPWTRLELVPDPLGEEALGRHLAAVLGRARRLRDEERQRRAAERWAARALVGSDPSSRRLAELCQRVAGAGSSTVLVLGERGSGRRRVARAIHAASVHAAGPYLELDLARLGTPGAACAALFGTQAEEPWQRGLLSAAEGGSLVVGPVESAALEVQEALARLLAEGTYRRVGAESELPLRARLIFWGGAGLEERVGRGELREDLFYRLNVLSLQVPSLAERAGALPALAAALLEELAEERAEGCPRLSREALAELEARSWPGHLAELRALLERASRTSRGVLRPAHFAERAADTGDAGVLQPSPRSLREVEATWIRRVLQEERGNRSRAARALGIHRATLYQKLRQYGIE